MSIFKTQAFWLAAGRTLICSILGTLLAKLPYLSLIGALVLSLLLGMACQFQPKAIQSASAGIGFISNKFLRLGIILLGFKLNLIDLAQAGVKTILLACVIVACMIIVTYWVCRKFGAEPELAILTASGCGICGAAAVMGISPQIDAQGSEERKRENEVLAVAVVCVMGTVFTLVDILLKPILHLDASQFGVVAGGSLHEIAHAVAAGGAGGAESLKWALIMKLSRVLLLAPTALIVGIWYQKHVVKNATTSGKKKLPFPWFMLGFLLTSVLGTFLPFLKEAVPTLVQVAYIFLGMAMAALGMSVNFKVIAQRGKGVFTAAFITSVGLSIFTIIASKLFF